MALEHRHRVAGEDWQAGRVRVVRGGKRLANPRHHLDEAELTSQQWRQLWDAARMLMSADGESGKRYGNETIRVTPTGQVSIKLPAPPADLANTPHGRYTLSCPVVFAHRGDEWRDRIETNAAVAYTIHHDPTRDRWYVTAAWQRKDAPVVPIDAALAAGCIGVDTNDDHLAAWCLDLHGNPVGEPRRFFSNLAGTGWHWLAPPSTATPKSATPSRGCRTGHGRPAWAPPRSRTLTSPTAGPASSTAARSDSGA